MIALSAALIERIFGYPQTMVARFGHPVIWIGALIGLFDQRLNRSGDSFPRRRAMGVLALSLVLLAVLAVTLPLTLLVRQLPFGWLIEALLASSLLAAKGLRDAVSAVIDGLTDNGLEGGRAAVGHIVGRDTAALDEAGIARAAVETLAENASDGVVAPMVYLIVFGLPGIALYKAINTADSMIGHKSARHAAFGWAAARLDDWVNLVPARLTGTLFVLAARLIPGALMGNAWRAMRRDAARHASPNAGWPEAAMAGALGLALGGPRAYAGAVLDLPKMGSGRAALTRADIRAALRLYDVMLAIGFVLLGVLALIAAVL